jgi:hypothetical protein
MKGTVSMLPSLAFAVASQKGILARTRELVSVVNHVPALLTKRMIDTDTNPLTLMEISPLRHRSVVFVLE